MKTGDHGPIPRKLRDASNTYIFSLVPIRTRLGDYWDRYGPSVHRIASRLLLNQLGGKGSFERFGDSYVVTFDRLYGEAAGREGKRIYDQFIGLLTQGKGSEEDGRTSHNSESADAVDRPGFLRRVARWVKGFVRREVGAVKERQKKPSAKSPVTDGNTQADLHRRGAQNRRHAASSGHMKRGAQGRRVGANNAKTTFEDPEDRRAGSPSPKNSDLFDCLNLQREARSIENAIALAVLRRHAEWSAIEAERNFPPPDLNFLYRSMWNLRSRHLTTCTSVPICWKNSMEAAHGECVVPPPRRPKALFQLDILCLENTIEILLRLIERKRPVLFMNVVHASTLINKDSLGQYLALLETLPRAARQQLIVEIVNIDEHAQRPEAIRMVSNLSSYARALAASVNLEDPNFAFWKDCGFMAVGADLSRDQRSESEIIASLTRFAAQAKRSKLLCYLRELNTLSVTISAVGAGFDFLEGAAVGSSEDPENFALSQFNIENLYDDKAEVA